MQWGFKLQCTKLVPMEALDIIESPAKLALQEFSDTLDGELVLPTSSGYEEIRQVWNGMIDRRPAVIVQCESIDDIKKALTFARIFELDIAVRGGGHNVAGSALVEDGVVIDLSRMKQIDIDAVTRWARVQPGVLIGELDWATQQFGLAAPMGVVTETGIAGLTLGGGLGWMRRKHGLSCDALLSVDVVTADGELVHASASENSDLFWAVRGGGGNFGIVVNFEFELFDVGPEVFFLAVAYPESEAKAVLQHTREFMEDAPEAFSPIGVLAHAPAIDEIPPYWHGEPCVILVGPYIGEVEEGREALMPLQKLGNPIFDFSDVMPYLEVQKFFDEDYPKGGRYYWKSSNLEVLTDESIEALILENAKAPSHHSTIDIWFQGGEMGRVEASVTAFGSRSADVLIGVEANWSDPSMDKSNIAWARQCIEAVLLYSDGSTYLNFPGIDEDGEERLKATYRENYTRLKQIKSKYDPKNVFKTHQNVKPLND